MKTKCLMKRLVSIILTAIMVMCMGTVAYAAETVEDLTTVEESISNNDEGIMPLSSISGYAQKTITHSDNTIIVWCDGSKPVNGSTVYSYRETQFQNLLTKNPAYYAVTFDVPEGVSFNTQIWIYG